MQRGLARDLKERSQARIRWYVIHFYGAYTFSRRYSLLASGDLRNVVRSVNALPEDYAGHLDIIINDKNPLVVLRNVIILMILGFVEDVVSGRLT